MGSLTAGGMSPDTLQNTLDAMADAVGAGKQAAIGDLKRSQQQAAAIEAIAASSDRCTDVGAVQAQSPDAQSPGAMDSAKPQNNPKDSKVATSLGEASPVAHHSKGPRSASKLSASLKKAAQKKKDASVRQAFSKEVQDNEALLEDYKTHGKDNTTKQAFRKEWDRLRLGPSKMQLEFDLALSA